MIDVVAGYAGGKTANPTYEDVETGETGHAESVRVTYDPGPHLLRAPARRLLAPHRPADLNSAFCDYGPQYRSIIFYHDAEQRRLAEASKRALDDSHRFRTPDRDGHPAGHAVLRRPRSTISGSIGRIPDAMRPTGSAAGGTLGSRNSGEILKGAKVKATRMLGIARRHC